MEQPIELMEIKKRDIDEIEVTSRLLNIILGMNLEQQLDLLEKLDTKGYGGARRHVRTYLKKPWAVFFDPEKDKASCADLILDISRCGMFIETSQPFRVGEKITVKFEVPANRKTYKILGEIVRLQEKGMGVRFIRRISAD
ncbi:MAG: hypothetical protein A3J80_11610 [Desulfobacula sp. RIFOXYB2_FULL_45_6]|nr:MAG: hypothetical protein A3J80_11610 [Desulfobacula sp. RIFOXYB2_FULL_45_6]